MNSLCSIHRSLRGFLPTHSAPVTLFHNVQVVVRADDHGGRVKVISGGGSGHEPAHAGYVGPNHLTTAIAGEIFASPSVQQILAGILASGQRDDAFLLLVNNYTGDRLNFSLARDIAMNSLGFSRIEILMVADDVAIENVQESVGRRGLAGCVLMIKIAGAMAEDGKSLQEIHSYCSEISRENHLVTIGFTFRSNLKSGEITSVEIGKGIHGEPGASGNTNFANFEDIAQYLVEKFRNALPGKSKIVLMLNNLGGTSQHLMNVFQYNLIPRISAHFEVVRIVSGTFMTSLDQEGISVTLLNISGREEILNYLSRGISIDSHIKSTLKDFDLFAFNQLSASCNVQGQKIQGDPDLLFRIFKSACNDLLAECNVLNEMDSELGDGDTGTTISQGVTHLLERFTNPEDFRHPGHFLAQLSWELSGQMGGSSGALYGIFFQAASTAFTFPNASLVKLQDWLEALHRGNEALKAAARAKSGDRTMLDPLLAIEEFFKNPSLALQWQSLQDVMTLVSLVAKSAANTQNMIPKAGRAAYTMENTTDSVKSFKYPDPGAHAVSIWFQGILKCFRNTRNDDHVIL